MRILDLSLKAVGPFTNARLDLSAGRHGLHVIHGPNEAGKTSALRALAYLLFRFPVRTDDAFVHPYDQLRVGATIEHSSGETLQIVRRKGNKNTLREGDDSTIVADGTLERFLGGIDEETFENLFGIDHRRLRAAGEEIRTGQGRLGELLFAAGTGLAGLGQAKDRLQQRLDALFKPRGQNQKINQALAEYREAQEAVKRAQLPSEEWLRHEQALRDAERAADEVTGRIQSARRALNRQNRIRDAIAPAARRRRLVDERAQLGAVAPLREGFGAEARGAQDALQLGMRTIQQARAVLAELEQQTAATAPRGDLLDAAAEIEYLQEELGAVEKALLHRPRLDNWRQDQEHQANAVLARLGLSRDLEAADELRLRADEPTKIRALAQRYAVLNAHRDEVRAAITKREDLADSLERERSSLGAVVDLTVLRRASRQATKAGDLDGKQAQLRVAADRAVKASARALAALPGWSGPLAALETQQVPLDATIDRIELDWQTLEREIQALDERIATADSAARNLDAQIRALDLQQDVPTEEQLRTHRARRDDGWKLVRTAWLDPPADAFVTAKFISELAPDRTLADAFEHAVNQADSVADRLRREAERVARKAEWLGQLDARRADKVEAARIRDQAAAKFDAVRQRLIALGGPLDVAVESPAELRAWLRARLEVVQLAATAHAAVQEVEALDRAIAEHRAALASALSDVGAITTAAESGLGPVAEHAEAILDREDKRSRRLEELSRKAAEAQAELDRDRKRAATVDDDLLAWRQEWSAAMSRIRLEREASPEQAEVVLGELHALADSLAKRRDHVSRIRGIDRDAAQFADHVATLCQRVAPDLEGAEPSASARALAERLASERAAEQQRTALNTQRERESQRLLEAERERDAATTRLERLCREAGCASADALPEAERRWRDRVRLDDELRACDDQLAALGGGATAADFAAQVEQADLDDLGPDIARREAEVETLEAELHTFKESIGRERGELGRWAGGDDAAQAAEKVQALAARLQGDVAQYAKLRLAATVLDRSIERFRDKSQGPVLARASELFRILTTGSFDRLQIDDDDGRALLKGVRPDGRLVGVEGMSDGSHDQLYLALRLASLESWLQAHEPIPFVVDDILLNFDDRRALAALLALAELSRRTQILFFTHHAHLVDLARNHLPADVAFVHELPAR